MTEEFQLTEFNSNQATLMRIDKLLRYCAEAYFSDDLENYYSCLMVFYKEVHPKLKKDHGKKKNKKNEEDNPYVKCERLRNDLKKLKKVYARHPQTKEEFRDKLEEFEEEIRCFADKKGMLLKDSDTSGL